ncbi:replication initiator protein A [Neisseria sp. Ec49-e6-T10]|uniref:replication initiator protein A n=1 Tax=Neisseria sp. Ec49-e6-T10 TaxID=3140744 RepID=UPI003EB8CA62
MKKKPEHQLNFFMVDAFASLLKNHHIHIDCPIFVLKAGNVALRRYKDEHALIVVEPGEYGSATIYDKDLLIYCISKQVEAMRIYGVDIDQTIQFKAHDFLVTTNRRTDGDNYKRLIEALHRLKDTTIEVYINDEGYQKSFSFDLIASWCILEKSDKKRRMEAIEITLPDIIHEAILAKKLLAFHADYFKLRKPLERHLYTLARKYCATQVKWSIDLESLYQKTGTTATIHEFRRLIRSTAKLNNLPEYQLRYETGTDIVHFYKQGARGYKAQIRDMVNQLNKKRTL